MRGILQGLPSPAPLITRLPGIMQDDEVLQRLLPAFDDSIAPVYSALDNLSAYVDPRYAPADFLGWMAGWVDVEIGADWPLEQRRGIVSDAVALHRMRGTASGIAQSARLAAGPGAEVQVTDSGGVDASAVAGSPVPGTPEAWVRVSVRTELPAGKEGEDRVRRAVAGAVPAHVSFSIEFLSG